MRRIRNALVLCASLAVLSMGTAAAGGAATSSSLSNESQWYTVASGIGESYGLAPDGAGGLLSFSYTTNDASPLYDFSAVALSGAASGVPVAPLPTPIATAAAVGGQWDAGIAVAADGSIYFTTSSNTFIYHYDPATRTTSTLTFGSVPWRNLTGLVLSPNGQDLYVSDQSTGDIYRIDLANSAISTIFTTPGEDLQQMAFDASGNLFVVDHGDNEIDEITATTLGTLTSPVQVGQGAIVVASWGSTAGHTGMTGLAFDSAGDLFMSDYHSGTGYPSVAVVPAVQLSQVEVSGSPATFANGQMLDVADASTPAIAGPQPLAVVGDVLYVGNYDGENIVALPISALGLLHVNRPQDVGATRVGAALSVTWVGGTAPFHCVLLEGFNDPTSYAVSTFTKSCSFNGLSLFVPYGVEVISGWTSSVPISVDAFAPAPGLTCLRGGHVRHYYTVGSRCPRGWHATTT